MSSFAVCPASARLKLLLDNLLPSAEQFELVRHLDGCPSCQLTLDELARDGKTADLRVLAGADAVRSAPSLVRVLDGLKTDPALGLLRRPGPSEEWVLSLLGPCETPNMLGRLGPYEISEVLGHGGMGVVLKAFDPGLSRWVAIKVLAPHLAGDPMSRRRFAREGRAAAAVFHENVVAVHAVDEHNGLPYLVMEYVPGPSLEEYLQLNGPPDVRSILRLALQLTDGLAAAHAAGVLHRDVKPANVLLRNVAGPAAVPSRESKEDKREEKSAAAAANSAPPAPPTPNGSSLTPLAKLTDFGLARAQDEGRLTQTGFLAGTPMYMAPEQALGETLDFRSDLFSLGGVFYTLCTGKAPFQATSAMGILRQVCEATPPPVREVNPAVPIWFTAVVARLQAKRPADRFASASEVADLLRRHLAHLDNPSIAPAPPLVRFPPPRRRRWRVALALAALAAITLVGALALRYGFQPVAPAPQRVLEGHDGPVWAVAFAPRGQMLVSGGDDKHVLLWNLENGKPDILFDDVGAVFSLAFTPDGEALAMGSNDGVVAIRNVGDRQPLAAPPRRTGSVTHLAFSADGRLLAESGGGGDAAVLIWDRQTGQSRRLEGHQAVVRAVVFAPDQDLLASGDGNGVINLWDLKTDKVVHSVSAHASPVRALAFSPDGRTLASASGDQTVKLWDAATLQEKAVLRGHTNSVLCAAFAPDGRLLASGGRDGTVRLWDVAAQKQVVVIPAHLGAVQAIAFEPDGARLASAGEDKTIKLWDMTPYRRP
jgi:WD40 repeat protein/serine/threonine protein kinase